MKLNKTKVLEIIRRKNEDWTSYKIRKNIGVTERRVNQILKEYCDTDKIPAVLLVKNCPLYQFLAGFFSISCRN